MFNTYDESKPFYNQMGYDEYTLDRFWSKVDVKKHDDGTDDLNTCMIWTAGCFTNGYGSFSYKQNSFVAHRFSYQCYNGPIPEFNEFGEKLCVRHKCDIPLCVNPLHLKIGTNQQNSDDMVERNRQNKGMNVHTCILTEKQVLEVQRMLDNGIKSKLISEKFDVNEHTIYKIRSGQNWSHLTGIKKGDYKDDRRLLKSQVLEIKEMLDQYVPVKIIANKFNKGTALIYSIRLGRYWSDVTGIKKNYN